MAKVALPSREKAKASASFAFSMPQRQQGRFLRAEGKLPAVFPSSPFPSFFRFLIKRSHSLFYRVPGKKRISGLGRREVPFSTARPEKEILSLFV
ncbi:hypothetical protein NKE62_11195 [Akkermansia sp. Marseille-P9185]|uniref:hypothetical protein n=1 Tax=Akkermansia massiliensis TaxID=2927224 RepID=UPI00209C25DC|nr:hypothetical protein [Akkermansia massiliensis]MCO8187488.1 hypothetical protein [Akkermansia massiliensis]